MTGPTGLTLRQRSLLDALDGAVPVFIMEMRDWSFEERKASLDIEAVTNTTDVLQFSSRVKRPKSERDASVRAFNAVARGLAVTAFQPGGVWFAGRHWCVSPHCGCPVRRGARCVPVCAVCVVVKGGGAAV